MIPYHLHYLQSHGRQQLLIFAMNHHRHCQARLLKTRKLKWLSSPSHHHHHHTDANRHAFFSSIARTVTAHDIYFSSIDSDNTSSASNKIMTDALPPFTIGIMRETYNHWERRTPLCPQHVFDILQKNNTSTTKTRVLVQPSTQRIFTNKEYESAGAIIQEDLSPANVILGVKQPPHHGTSSSSPSSSSFLFPDKTYLFFAHVIKGQVENMELLQEIIDKNITLMDYECIVVNSQNFKPTRLVAFGKYAGIAGMMDSFQVLGRRLLCTQNVSTPFLHVPPTHFHYDLQSVKESVQTLSDRIISDGIATKEPIVITMTGHGGKVHGGAHDEIFSMLPHEIIQVEDLPELFANHSRKSDHEANFNRVYGVNLGISDLYRHVVHNDQHSSLPLFDRAHFDANPSEYVSTFATQVAPYTQLLVNCMYWDQRYPRLLTKKGMKKLVQSGNKRLLVISDVSCDINGSIEFTERATTIDNPCIQYDPIMQRETPSNEEHDEAEGISILAVDILPSELPVDSSIHFGNAVSSILDDIRAAMGSNGIIDPNKLPSHLAKALITTPQGKLSKKYQYLQSFLDRLAPHDSKTAAMSSGGGADDQSIVILFEGHLFDSGLINQVLDVIDNSECGFEFLECFVRPRKEDSVPVKSSAVVRITGSANVDLERVQSKIQALIDAIEKAEATMTQLRDNQFFTKTNGSNGSSSKSGGTPTASPTTTAAVTDESPSKMVVILGAGLVSKSVVDMLGESMQRKVIVADTNENAARRLASLAKRGEHVYMDATQDKKRMTKLVKEADVMISLLPAPMHPEIAELCIRHGTDLVTASYESDDMRSLHDKASQAGIRILNEVGLDPGLDHMSAMKIIDDIQERGGEVTSFISVCGGLPAPEAANNPFQYKFSWNPRGVITASQNDAKYKWDNKIVEVHGKELLQHAKPFVQDAWPELDLECIPNRNSLQYLKTYGIENVQTMFRGTLRYRDFGSVLRVFQNMGYLSDSKYDIQSFTTFNEIHDMLCHERGGFINDVQDFVLACADDNANIAQRAMDCLRFLDMIEGSNNKSTTTPLLIPSAAKKTMVDIFCHQLQQKLQFEPHERDMVVMHHSIGAKFIDKVEQHESKLLSFGKVSDMSAMCKTVGYTTAAGANLLLENQQPKIIMDSSTSPFLLGYGLLLPTKKEIYNPILAAVQEKGIVFDETVKVVLK